VGSCGRLTELKVTGKSQRMNFGAPAVLMVVGSLALSGCSGMSDRDRTATEGAMLGSAAGAVIGAGVGYFVDGFSGAGYGALIGAGVGLAGGAALGQHAAYRKAEFAKSADYLDACIGTAYAANVQMALYNRSLTDHLVALDSELSETSVAVAETGGTDKRRGAIAGNLRDANDQLARVSEEIDIQHAVLDNERAAQPAEAIGNLEKEIGVLEGRKAELEALIRKLHEMDSRLLAG